MRSRSGKGELNVTITDAPFFAAGDGISSDRTAFLAAQAAAAAANVPLKIGGPPGTTYLLSGGSIDGVSGVTYDIDPGVIIKCGASTPTMLDLSATTGVVVKGGVFDGAGLVSGRCVKPGNVSTFIEAQFISSGLQHQAAYAVSPLQGDTISDVLFVRCKFWGLRNNIHIYGIASNWTVRDCLFDGFASSAIACDGGTTYSSTNIKILDNEFRHHNPTTLAVSNKAITGGDLATLTVPTHVRTVTDKALASNVATLTFDTHSYVVGQWVHISGVGAPFDGYFPITAITGTTISFARTAADVTSDASTGTVATYVVGEAIYVDVGDAIFDGNWTLTGVTATTVSFAQNAANSSAASAGYVASGNRQPISFQGNDAAFHREIYVRGNHLRGNFSNHQSHTLGGTADMISLHRCEVFEVHDNIVVGSGDVGITISLQCHNGSVQGNTIDKAGNVGIAVGAAGIAYVRDVSVLDNTISNCGQNGSGTWGSAGINIRKMLGGLVSGNTCIDDQTKPPGVGTATFTTATFTDAGDLVTTPLAHGLAAGQRVTFTTITTTTGITAYKFYYVLTAPGSTTLTLSATLGGPTLSLTTDGTGGGMAVAAPTQGWGMTVGDTIGTSEATRFGINTFRGNGTGFEDPWTRERWTLPGNVDLRFADDQPAVVLPADTVAKLDQTLADVVANGLTLQVFLEANATYEIDVLLPFTMATPTVGNDPGLQSGFAFSGTTTSVAFWADAPGATTAAGAGTSQTTSSNRAFFTSLASVINSGGATGAAAVRQAIKVRIVTGVSSGFFTARYAQQTTNADNGVTVAAGASMKPKRVA